MRPPECEGHPATFQACELVNQLFVPPISRLKNVVTIVSIYGLKL